MIAVETRSSLMRHEQSVGIHREMNRTTFQLVPFFIGMHGRKTAPLLDVGMPLRYLAPRC